MIIFLVIIILNFQSHQICILSADVRECLFFREYIIILQRENKFLGYNQIILCCLGKTQIKKCGFLNGRTTKVWVPPPLDLSGSYFFSSIFSFDEKKFFLLSGQWGLTLLPLSGPTPKKNFFMRVFPCCLLLRYPQTKRR